VLGAEVDGGARLQGCISLEKTGKDRDGVGKTGRNWERLSEIGKDLERLAIRHVQAVD